jgi:hypothetical protein
LHFVACASTRLFEKDSPMAADRSSFLVIAAALAAGAVGGWALRERNPALPDPRAESDAKPIAAPAPTPLMVEVTDPVAASSAACDDSVGASEECPSVGPSDEGMCANVIYKRCGDYKSALKPRVAQRAVACLKQLKGNERCDAVRINQCGHAALMAACPEPTPPAKGAYLAGAGVQPASFTLAKPPQTGASSLTKSCVGLTKTCSGQPLGPSVEDCRQTLAGMNEAGRASTLECAAGHCSDRGLLGCEAVTKAPPSAPR